MNVFNPREVEALFLIRDGLTMTLDGVNRILEGTEPKEEQTPQTYDLMQVVTVQTEGPKGQYLKITHENNLNNPAYFALIEDLKQHKGTITRQGYFVFLFDDKKTAGMKLNKH